MFAATMLVNAAAITTWLFPRQLVDLGFPHDLVLWYTGLGIAASAAGVVALRIVEARIDGVRAARPATPWPASSAWPACWYWPKRPTRCLAAWACCWSAGSGTTSPGRSAWSG